MKQTYKVVISRIIKEEVEMEIEAKSFMGAYDSAQKIINIRNNKTNKQFHIIKLEKKERVSKMNNKNRPRIMYLRDHKKNPVGCVAISVDRNSNGCKSCSDVWFS